MTFKESFNIAGLPTTWGNPAVQGFRGERRRAYCLPGKRRRCRHTRQRQCAVGARVTGKAITTSTERLTIPGTSPYPRGSSGGSAAALAAGFGPLSLARTLVDRCACQHTLRRLRAQADAGSGAWSRTHAAAGPAIGATTAILPSSARWPEALPILRLALDVVAGPDEERAGIGYRLALPPLGMRILRTFVSSSSTRTRSCQHDSAVRTAFERCRSDLSRLVSKSQAPVHCFRTWPILARLYMRL